MTKDHLSLSHTHTHSLSLSLYITHTHTLLFSYNPLTNKCALTNHHLSMIIYKFLLFCFQSYSTHFFSTSLFFITTFRSRISLAFLGDKTSPVIFRTCFSFLLTGFIYSHSLGVFFFVSTFSRTLQIHSLIFH